MLSNNFIYSLSGIWYILIAYCWYPQFNINTLKQTSLLFFLLSNLVKDFSNSKFKWVSAKIWWQALMTPLTIMECTSCEEVLIKQSDLCNFLYSTSMEPMSVVYLRGCYILGSFPLKIFILIITNLVTVEEHNTKYLKRGAYLLLSEWKTTLRKRGTRDFPLVSTW